MSLEQTVENLAAKVDLLSQDLEASRARVVQLETQALIVDAELKLIKDCVLKLTEVVTYITIELVSTSSMESLFGKRS